MSIRAPDEGHDEFADLARAFNQSVISLELFEQRFKTIFEAFPFPIVINRLSDAIFINMNTAAEAFFEHKRDELIGLSSWHPRFNTDPEASINSKNRLMRSGQLDNEPYKITRSDGTIMWIIYSTRLIKFGDEQVALTVLTDVTALKQAEFEIAAGESIRFETINLAADGAHAYHWR